MLKSGFFKRALLMAFVALSTVGMSVDYAEAARLGGGRSTGMQRTMPQRQATPPAYQRPAPATPPAAAPASGWRKWAGPLAGLAAGIGLAALMSHFGMGGDMAGILLLVIGGVLAFVLIRRFMGGNRAQQPAMASGPANWQQQQPAQYEAQQAYGGGAAPAAAATIPADFDVDGFTRQAKVNFIRLQAANDAGNLQDIREFTSPEMFAEIKLDIDDRRGAAQKTDVVSLDAQVLEVVEESGRYITSVRFNGMLREAANSAPAPFDEVWHLSKPVDGNSGWVLSGIQQVA
ncbi:TIM44-like domain-containing protein [Uliginosibacterium sp. H3]|uniref:TIM44-like domain-containing protein n=1 Tax=Uliginosibacterium silvisoli TaxID=3114758 RepID=A0ABU6K073_9RHOO|nr:TIM44-like domain-containing protein [Uliginosibacterium sp. H3]